MIQTVLKYRIINDQRDIDLCDKNQEIRNVGKLRCALIRINYCIHKGTLSKDYYGNIRLDNFQCCYMYYQK